MTNLKTINVINVKFNPKWKKSIALTFSLVVFIVILYSNTFLQMVRLWNTSDTYAHGFVVPFISFWLIWRVRETWLEMEPQPFKVGLVLICLSSIVWFFGNLVSVNSLTQFSFILMICLCIPTMLGWEITKKILFPITFLFFAVPIGDFLLPIMMSWTADFTVVALQLTGIPVYRENLQFVIPSGRWSVVEACSGIRYLLASVTVGSLFAYLNYQNFTKRLIFVLFAIIVPLVANWLRAYMIVLIGHYSGNKLATGVDHLIYGWLFFGLIIIVMLFIGMKWADPEKTPVINSEKRIIDITNVNKNAYYLYFLCLIVLLAPIAVNNFIDSRIKIFPVTIGELDLKNSWKFSKNPENEWSPDFPNSVFQSKSSYLSNDSQQVSLSISYFRKQNYESKLVTSTNTLINFNEKQWQKFSTEKKIILLKDNNFDIESSIIERKNYFLDGKDKKILVWKFYWVNDVFTSNDVYAKILGVISKIKGNGDDGAIVVIYSSFDSDVSSKSDLLKKFLEDNLSSIQNALLETKNRNY